MQTKNYYLAGANTAKGFISKFNEILDNNKNGFTYVLKGGPGTGKSTLMRKISEHFFEKGFSVENYFCSSDSASFDGVRIVEKNICVVDGTAPHEQDATIPMVNSKIVNLGDCIGAGVAKNKKQIEALILKKTQCFKKAYAYLECAGLIASLEDSEKKAKNKLEIANIVSPNFCSNGQKGSLRTAFFEFFEEKNIKSLEKENKLTTKIVDVDQNFLNNLKTELVSLGEDVVEIMDVLTLKTAGLVLTKNQIYLKVKQKAYSAQNKKLIKELFELISSNLAQAKQYHKKIEKYYVASLNFEKLNETTEKLIQEIERK